MARCRFPRSSHLHREGQIAGIVPKVVAAQIATMIGFTGVLIGAAALLR